MLIGLILIIIGWILALVVNFFAVDSVQILIGSIIVIILVVLGLSLA